MGLRPTRWQRRSRSERPAARRTAPAASAAHRLNTGTRVARSVYCPPIETRDRAASLARCVDGGCFGDAGPSCAVGERRAGPGCERREGKTGADPRGTRGAISAGAASPQRSAGPFQSGRGCGARATLRAMSGSGDRESG